MRAVSNSFLNGGSDCATFMQNEKCVCKSWVGREIEQQDSGRNTALYFHSIRHDHCVSLIKVARDESSAKSV